ncbi:MAG: AMP-binding protein, partial [Myxococcota bacterium]
LNLRWTTHELAHPLEVAQPRLLVHESGDLGDRARSAARAAGIAALAAPFEAPSSAGPAAPAGSDLDSLLAVLFTSGTTGEAKGAGLTVANFTASALAAGARLGTHPRDRWLACMPLYHVGGLAMLVRGALFGNTILIHERFEETAVNRALDRDGITHVSLVATMLARLLEDRGDRPAPSQLRCVLLGGGPAPVAVVERARSLGFPIAATYGLTEATSQVATCPPGASSDAPHPLPSIEVRVTDAADRELPDGEAGDLLVRGPTVMRGYVNRPEETARVLRGGWLHTGDVGVRQPDGGLRVLERRSDLILSGGENIYPTEVENALLLHPAVVEAAVAGVPDDTWGQRAAAWVVLAPGASPADPELTAFCRERLAGYKIPLAFRRVTSLPRNAAGKLLRRQLGDPPAPSD